MDESLKILEEHPDWVICVKPAGTDSEHEMPESLAAQLGGPWFPVHRLDRNVGGLMVYARSSRAAAEFSRLIQAGELVKEYVLLCHGSLPAQEGDMEDLLWKDPRKNKVYVVDRVRRGVRSAALLSQRAQPHVASGTVLLKGRPKGAGAD